MVKCVFHETNKFNPVFRSRARGIRNLQLSIVIVVQARWRRERYTNEIKRLRANTVRSVPSKWVGCVMEMMSRCVLHSIKYLVKLFRFERKKRGECKPGLKSKCSTVIEWVNCLKSRVEMTGCVASPRKNKKYSEANKILHPYSLIHPPVRVKSKHPSIFHHFVSLSRLIPPCIHTHPLPPPPSTTREGASRAPLVANWRSFDSRAKMIFFFTTLLAPFASVLSVVTVTL